MQTLPTQFSGHAAHQWVKYQTAPGAKLMQSFIDNKISVSTVCINPHRPRDSGTLKKVADVTGGRFYFVQDPRNLPQIFFREALQIRRNLINEEDFFPQIALETEPIRGLAGLGAVDPDDRRRSRWK